MTIHPTAIRCTCGESDDITVGARYGSQKIR